MSLLGSKPCHGSSVPSMDLRPAGVDTQGLPDSYSWSLPLIHSAPAKTCLHSPLSITGTQAALHWLFSPAETILPLERSQTHPLLQVFVLLSSSCWCLLPTSPPLAASLQPHYSTAPPLISYNKLSITVFCAFLTHSLLLHCKLYKDRICLFCSSTAPNGLPWWLRW